MKQGGNFGLEVLVAFFNTIDNDIVWWYKIWMSNGDADEDCDYLFPSLNKIFGMHKNAMRFFTEN